MDFPSVIKPQFPIQETTMFSSLKDDIKYGPSMHRRKWASGIKRRMFNLTYKYATKIEMQLMNSFFTYVKGIYSSFAWTHPVTSVVFTVRLGDPNIQFNESGEDSFNFTLTLIEVL